MQFLGFLSYAGALWFGVMAGANMVICNELRGGDVAEAKALGSLFLSAALMVEGHRLLAYGHF